MGTVDEVIASAKERAEAGDIPGAWALMHPHGEWLLEHPRFAWAWIVLAGVDPDPARHRELVETLLEGWVHDPGLMQIGTSYLTDLVDGRTADEPIHVGDPALVAARFARRSLAAMRQEHRADPEVGGQMRVQLGTALRLAGPSYDDECEEALREAIALAPDRAWWRFDLGLLYKQRGRWAEGRDVFREVDGMVEGDDSATLVNLAICATGAGDGSTALDSWRRLGMDGAIGEDDLPTVDDLGPVKLRLSSGGIGAEHPGEGPVEFEHVWLEPRSPCHGVVLNATMYDVGADIGDVVLYDQAPIGFVEHAGHRIPRFPWLATLRSGEHRTFRFLAEQLEPGGLGRVEDGLPGGTELYVWDEKVDMICAAHVTESTIRTEPNEATGVVAGKLVVPPDTALADVAASLRGDAARIAVPALHEAMGDELSARRHGLLWDELSG